MIDRSSVLVPEYETQYSESPQVFTYLSGRCIQTSLYIRKESENNYLEKVLNKNGVFFPWCLNFLKSAMKNAKNYPFKMVL